MDFQDLIATFRAELATSAESLPDWIAAMADGVDAADDPQVAAAADDALASYVDMLQRSSETASMLGLEGLGAFMAHRAACVAMPPEPLNAEQLFAELQWFELADAYLQQPGEQSAMPLCIWLADHAAGDADADAVVVLLAQEVAIPDELLETPERRQFAAEALSLQVAQDVDPAVYGAFANDAPAQAGQASAALQAYFRSEDADAAEAALASARRIVHTFKGTASMVSVRGIGTFSHAFEDLLDRLAQKKPDIAIPDGLKAVCIDAADMLESMVEAMIAAAPVPRGAMAALQRVADWEYVLAAAGWNGAEEMLAGLPALVHEEPAETPRLELAASVANNGPVDDSRPSVRVPLDVIDALLRASGETAVFVSRLKQALQHLGERDAQLGGQHRTAQMRAQAMQLAVDTQSSRQAARSGSDMDALEFDQYNELSSLSRLLSESVDDARVLGLQVQPWIAQVENLLSDQSRVQKQMQQTVLATRLNQAQALSARLARVVRQTARMAGKEALFSLEGGEVALDSDVLDSLAAPLVHLLRNAVDHGLEPADVRLAQGKPADGSVLVRFTRVGARVELDVIDDGRGFDYDAIRRKAITRGLLAADEVVDQNRLASFVTLPGFSTAQTVTDISGRGVGMDVVADSVRRLGGQLRIESVPGQGTRMQIRVPASLALMHMLIVQTSAGRFAVPSAQIDTALAPGIAEIHTGSDGKQKLVARGTQYRAISLASRFGGIPNRAAGQCSWLLLDVDGEPTAVAVEQLVTARDALMRKIVRLEGHTGLLGGTIDLSVHMLPVLDLPALVRIDTTAPLIAQAVRQAAEPAKILVVDDSVSVRRALAQLLEDAGYAVMQARDGLDALTQMGKRTPLMVLTDLEMPEMNGIDLTRNLRADPRTEHVPVVMITSRSTGKHRELAHAAGVSEYLVKPYVDQTLLDLIAELARNKSEASV